MFNFVQKHKIFGLILVVFLASGIILSGNEITKIIGTINLKVAKSCLSNQLAFAEENPLIKEEQTIFSQNRIVFYEPCTAESSGNSFLSGIVSISGTTAEEKVWSGLTSFMKEEQAAGVMGNMVGESGLGPSRHQGTGNGFSSSIWDKDSGKGLGLIQWDGGRRPEMANYVKKRFPSLVKYLEEGSTYGGLSGDQFIEKVGHEDANKLYQAEIEFLKSEIDKSYQELYKKNSPDDAPNYFAKSVERCADCVDPAKINGENMSNRRKRANEIYSRQSGRTFISNGESSSTVGASNSDVTSSLHDKAWELADQPMDSAKQGPTEAYLKAQEEAKCPGTCVDHGKACTHYVATVVRASGVDSDFPYGYVSTQEEYMKNHPETYTLVNGDASKEETYQPGDIRVKGDSHIEIYGQRDGQGYILAASIAGENDPGYWAGYKNFFGGNDNYRIYRTQGTPKCVAGSSGSNCAQNNMDVVATAICLAHPIDVSDKDRAWHGGHPTANFKAANDAVFKGHGNGQRASGAACDIGAAVVVRYSGVDKNFPGGLGAGMIPLAKDGGNKKWDVIKTSSLDDFQPGDVALREGHVWVYIGKIGNKHYGVQSHMKRKYNGKAGAYLAVEESSDERVTWALRPKNAKEQQTVITEEMLKNAGTSNSLKASSSTTNSTETSTETSTTTGESARGTGNIAAAALELGWPKGTAKSKYKVNRSTKEGNWTPAGRKYFDEITKKKYKYGTSNDGASCSIYATTVLKYAGVIDTEKVHRSPSWIQKQLQKDTENWEEVKIEKVSDYQSGDVLIRPGNVKGHAAIYVEVDGKGYLSEGHYYKAYGAIDKEVKKVLSGFHVFRYKGKVEEKKAAEDNCDYCEEVGDSTGGTGLKEGGMTLAEAKAWMESGYRKEAAKKEKKSTYMFEGAMIQCPSGGCSPHGTLNNCSAFSQWFANRYTTLGPKGVGLRQGSDTVNKLASEHGVKTGNEPQPYAVFSTNSPNHTGVVMGVSDGGKKIVICEASWHNGYTDYWPGCRELAPPSHYSYAYLGDLMNPNAFGAGGGGGGSF